MVKLLAALVAVLPALAQTDYLVPYADGSDGWSDAYQQAKGKPPDSLRSPGY
jgi:hypothetical protein